MILKRHHLKLGELRISPVQLINIRKYKKVNALNTFSFTFNDLRFGGFYFLPIAKKLIIVTKILAPTIECLIHTVRVQRVKWTEHMFFYF